MAPDPYKYFRIEARELLEELGKGILELEKRPAAPEVVARLLRLAHTLKGAARVVKQREIADQAHAIEATIAPIRDAGAEVSRELVDGVLQILDAMAARMVALAPPPETAAVAPLPPGGEEGFRVPRADVNEMDAVLDGVAEVNVQLASVRRAVRSLADVRQLAELLADQLASPKVSARGIDASSTRSTADELRDRIHALERELTTGIDQTDR